MFDHFLNASTACVAYFVFIVSTLRYRDRQSTATKRYLTSQLFFARLSTCAKSNDQISLISFTITLSQGNCIRIKRYFVKEGVVSKKNLTFANNSLLCFCNCFELPKDARHLE